jgi:signal peptidase
LRGTQDSEPVDDDKPPLWRRMLSWTFTLMIVATTVFLWPASLGGSTRLVIVSGRSMEPTYELGDMVITRDSGNSTMGDPVVFEIPEGSAEGSLVIHRIVDVDDEGRFITQGDNRETADNWRLTESDVVGQPLLHVPNGGLFVRFLQQWWVISILVGLLVVFVLWPSAEEDDDEIDDGEEVVSPASPIAAVATLERRADDDHVRPEFDTTTPLDISFLDDIDLDALDLDDTEGLVRPGPWMEREIDQEVMDDALAWLDEQLDGVVSSTVP